MSLSSPPPTLPQYHHFKKTIFFCIGIIFPKKYEQGAEPATHHHSLTAVVGLIEISKSSFLNADCTFCSWPHKKLPAELRQKPKSDHSPHPAAVSLLLSYSNIHARGPGDFPRQEWEFCSPRPERLPEGEARGQSRGSRGAKSPPEGNLEGRGGCITQCIAMPLLGGFWAIFFFNFGLFGGCFSS